MTDEARVILYNVMEMPIDKLKRLARENPAAWAEVYAFEKVRRAAELRARAKGKP